MIKTQIETTRVERLFLNKFNRALLNSTLLFLLLAYPDMILSTIWWVNSTYLSIQEISNNQVPESNPNNMWEA